MSMGAANPETGTITGTKDVTYDIVWYLQQCLDNALRLEQYRADAESEGDQKLSELFAKAQADSVKGAEMAKLLLRERLAS